MTASNGVPQCARILDAAPQVVVLAGTGRGEEIPVMRRLWRRVKIIGIEALQEHWRLMGRNQCEPDVFVRGALWHTSGETIKFHLNYEPDQRATTYALPVHLPGAITRDIRTVTLDEIEQRHGPWPDDGTLLWMDIEGAEFEALRTSECVRQQIFRWINVELSFCPARNVPPWHHTVQVLLGAGYRMFALHSLSKNGRQADAVFLRDEEWHERNLRTTMRSVRRKLERLAAGRGRVQAEYDREVSLHDDADAAQSVD